MNLAFAVSNDSVKFNGWKEEIIISSQHYHRSCRWENVMRQPDVSCTR